MPQEEQRPYEEIPYDHLIAVGKETGSYGSIEFTYQGNLGMYRLRVGQSIIDDQDILQIYQNNKLFITLYPTRTKKVFVGEDEDGKFYVFRFAGKQLDVFKRRYDF